MNYEHFISLSIPVFWSGKPITLSICSDLCRFPQGSSSFLHPAWTVWLAAPLTAFGHSHFGFAWSQWEEGTWKQTPVRPETPNWFTLALLLAGVSSGLRTAEKATIWLHVWVYFICFPLALPLPTTSDNGRWLPYLQALIQGSYLPFEAQAAYKAWGLHQP